MSRWSDGRVLSKKCWALLRSNRYFLWFPIVGVVLSLIPLLIFGGIAVTIAVAASGIAWLAWIIGLIGLVFVNFAFTLSGAAMVAAIDEELAGRDSSLGYGFGKAFGKLAPLFLWSIIRAIVNAIFGALRGNGEGAASILGSIVAGLGAAAWSIVTFFVTPYIMFESEGAVASIKKSAHLVREKWGTQLAGGVRIGLSLALVFLPAIALIVLGAFALGSLPTLGLILLIVGFLLFLVGALLSSALRSIFSVALYRFATDAGELGPFTSTELQSVLVKK
ncbi:MAG: hypothetical protein RL205_469 [Actinomycetota bacterium]